MSDRKYGKVGPLNARIIQRLRSQGLQDITTSSEERGVKPYSRQSSTCNHQSVTTNVGRGLLSIATGRNEGSHIALPPSPESVLDVFSLTEPHEEEKSFLRKKVSKTSSSKLRGNGPSTSDDKSFRPAIWELFNTECDSGVTSLSGRTTSSRSEVSDDSDHHSLWHRQKIRERIESNLLSVKLESDTSSECSLADRDIDDSADDYSIPYPISRNTDNYYKTLTSGDTKYAHATLKKGILPDQWTLNELAKRFGRTSSLIVAICNNICETIKTKNDSVVKIWPCCKDGGDHIVFLILVKRDELLEIKIDFAYVVRTMIDKGKEGREVIFSKDFKKSLVSISPVDKKCLRKSINAVNVYLMKKHNCLTMISGSPVRSKGFDQNLHEVKQETCIVLYVLAKGYIPIQEKPFKKRYFGVPVDVREGSFALYTGSPKDYHSQLKIGCQIQGFQMSQTGTLGGFLDFHGLGTCGLTCAHVLLTPQEMKCLSHKPEEGMQEEMTAIDRIVYQPDNTNGEHAVGRVVKAIYRHGGGDESGIDIALFQIDGRYPNLGDFSAQGPSSTPLNLAYDTGKIADYTRLGSKTLLKFGAETALTTGSLVLDTATMSVRTYASFEINDDFEVILHNLLEVKSNQNLSSPDFSFPFAQAGDSGALVFSRGENDQLFCVGVVEGGTSQDTCVVMPISPILKQLNLTAFKNFEKNRLAATLQEQLEKVSQDANEAYNKLETRIALVENQITQMRQSIDQNQQETRSAMQHMEQSQQRFENDVKDKLNKILDHLESSKK